MAKRDVETAELSIWFFCGILMLAYGFVLSGKALCEHFRILANAAAC